MRRKITVYGLRFSKTTFVDHINTGFLDPAVATVPTACGIETIIKDRLVGMSKLQQYLPLAVLKPTNARVISLILSFVATVPTACGIETEISLEQQFCDVKSVATVPTACGIETA